MVARLYRKLRAAREEIRRLRETIRIERRITAALIHEKYTGKWPG